MSCTYENGGEETGAYYNAMLYRGYYYDSDLGLYYLQSRYYDSRTGRFINADNCINANGDLIGYNMFAYCNNNPVNDKQRPVSSGGSITDSTIAGALGVGFVPIVTVAGGSSGIFNQTSKGSFSNRLLFDNVSITGLYADWNARAQISLKKELSKLVSQVNFRY